MFSGASNIRGEDHVVSGILRYDSRQNREDSNGLPQVGKEKGAAGVRSEGRRDRLVAEKGLWSRARSLNGDCFDFPQCHRTEGQRGSASSRTLHGQERKMETDIRYACFEARNVRA